MSKPYLFTLERQDQEDLFRAAETEKGLPAYVVEKDYYVTLVLKLLFEGLKPKHQGETNTPFVFKGGTTLSKVYGCIDRMSEDIDLSLDMKFLGHPPPASTESNTALKTRVKKLNTATSEAVSTILAPFLSEALAKVDDRFKVSILDNGTDIEVLYPNIFEGNGYISQRVLLECGGKAGLEPCAVHRVSPIALSRLDVSNDDCLVDVLGCDRTFFEKITALHEINSRGPGAMTDRQSRHIYDVIAIFQTHPEFLDNRELLTTVVEHKKQYFKRASSKWDEAVPGSLNLIPRGDVAKRLEEDWEKMDDMFPGERPWTFEKIMEDLSRIDRIINTGADLEVQGSQRPV